MLPFCFCPILITSCLRTKDTRLSTRYIFAFRESLGTRLIHIPERGSLGTRLPGEPAGTRLFRSMSLSVQSRSQTTPRCYVFKKQETQEGQESGERGPQIGSIIAHLGKKS